MQANITFYQPPITEKTVKTIFVNVFGFDFGILVHRRVAIEIIAIHLHPQVDLAQIVQTGHPVRFVLTALNAGNNKAARIPMMVITTSSSISVKARRVFMFRSDAANMNSFRAVIKHHLDLLLSKTNGKLPPL